MKEEVTKQLRETLMIIEQGHEATGRALALARRELDVLGALSAQSDDKRVWTDARGNQVPACEKCKVLPLVMRHRETHLGLCPACSRQWDLLAIDMYAELDKCDVEIAACKEDVEEGQTGSSHRAIEARAMASRRILKAAEQFIVASPLEQRLVKHAFVMSKGKRFNGPIEETCDVCGTDPRNVNHEV